MRLYSACLFNLIYFLPPPPSLTSSSSPPSGAGPLCASWKRIFFIFRYWRLSSSRTASLVRAIRSITTVMGRSLHRKWCWVDSKDNITGGEEDRDGVNYWIVTGLRDQDLDCFLLYEDHFTKTSINNVAERRRGSCSLFCQGAIIPSWLLCNFMPFLLI